MRDVKDDTDEPGALELRTERSDDEQVIALAGELDLDGAQRVREALQRAEAAEVHRIVLDLRDLDFIDSNGVRLIVEADVRSRTEGGRLELIPGPRPVQRVFELTGTSERLPFVDRPNL